MKAKTFTIIGDPVDHSLSPIMHQAAFRSLKLPFTYSKTHLTHRQLAVFFKKLKKENSVAGLNVTVPHKESVMKFLDEISEEAKRIGAVNTIVLEKGKLKGLNTDGRGYLLSLKKELRFDPEGKNMVILGAGGAARGILFALAQAKAKQILLFNRTTSRSKKLAKEFHALFPKTDIRTVSSLEEGLSNDTHLLINTTSVGMKGERFQDLPFDRLNRKAIVSDIIYRPRWTPLLLTAKQKGLRVHHGLGMLLYQGVLAFEIWTKKKAPVKIMKAALNRSLKGTV